MAGKGGEVAALKGGGKKGYKGKGQIGKGYKGKWNGNGKGYQSYKYDKYNQRYLGKAVGKGLNAFNNDYYDAWGEDMYSGCGVDNNNWWGEDWSQGNGMNVMMMLESGNASEESGKKSEEVENKKTAKAMKIAGERDPSKGTRRVEPILLCNKYNALQKHEDEDYQIEVEENATDSEDVEYPTKHKPKKRQRLRRKEMQVMKNNIDSEQDDQIIPPRRRGKSPHDNDKEVKDAAINNARVEMNWLGIGTTNTTMTQATRQTQPPNRHSTDYFKYFQTTRQVQTIQL